MQSKRRCLQNFEAKSVMLFAACALTTLAVHAQTPNSTAQQPQQQQRAATPSGQATFGGGATAQAQPGGGATSSVEAAAFARADKDRDGKLSRTESEQLPAVMQRFDQIDANKDGFLSRDEFDKGTRS